MTHKKLQEKLRAILRTDRDAAKIRAVIKEFASDPNTTTEDLRKVTQLLPKDKIQ